MSYRKITIGPKVEFVPNLLAGNTSVIKVVFEEDKTNPVPLEIGDGAFEYCTSLKIPSLPSRLTKLVIKPFINVYLLVKDSLIKT